MRRILCIWLADWPLRRITLARPALEGRPLVLWETVRGVQRVVAGTAEARRHGVAPGMSLAEAQALAGDVALHLEPADPVADREALQRLALWCDQFSPIVGLEAGPAPECLLLDVSGLEHLFGGEPVLMEKVIRGFDGRRLPIRPAIADTVGAAWAMARFAVRPGQWAIVPRGEAAEALRPLPIEALRLAGDTADWLRQLGVARVGQFAALPRHELASRFGKQLLERWDQATGRIDEPIVPYHPPPTARADCELEHPTTRREAIERLIAQLVEQLAAQLLRHGLGALRLECRLQVRPVAGEDMAESAELRKGPDETDSPHPLPLSRKRARGVGPPPAG